MVLDKPHRAKADDEFAQICAIRAYASRLPTLVTHSRYIAASISVEPQNLALLEAVIAAQAELVARWMLLGFIHGVMNTDNMPISGETIDYGPCAFMDSYDPQAVFSSIDQHGRTPTATNLGWQSESGTLRRDSAAAPERARG
ncbi:protein adenylyltransferase SelO family protein [Mesorhizobium sp. ESP6-5]|uniref:protein adenylyltransferase SelO family protein n=1 Tax=Mesorhizobium sp. ESP6-5 TaxID=2876623 RepID=UPI0021E27013|nr:protein adenylyltransferase SelO family protein [Mesorhizobium sp. ESP6-5]